MAITAAMIKQLRDATSAGFLDCKKALVEAEEDFDKAIEILRIKGQASADKKTDREANDGLIVAKVNDDGTKAAMVEVNCETDFVARTDQFIEFVNNLADQHLNATDNLALDAFMEASYIGNQGQTVAEALKDAISTLGENMVVNHIERYELGGTGVIDSYVHSNQHVGVLVALKTADAVSDKDALQNLGHELSLQVAATNPRHISTDDVPADTVEAERNILLAQLADDKKPDEIKAKIVDGRLKKFFSEICLLEQESVKDSSVIIKDLVAQASKNLGTDITVEKFTRFEIGAG